jgi:hypothetical protein
MSDFEPAPPVSVSSKVLLSELSPQFRFASSQAVDVVAVFDGHARAFEVKLGDTPLGVAHFRNTYSDGLPRVSDHDPPRVSGKVVPILEASGAPLPGSTDVRISLSIRDQVRGDVPVLREWFLVVSRQTLDLWRGPDLFGLLEVRRLTGVIAVESIAEALGIDRARREARAIAKEAIDTWFDGRRVPYRVSRVRGYE